MPNQLLFGQLNPESLLDITTLLWFQCIWGQTPISGRFLGQKNSVKLVFGNSIDMLTISGLYSIFLPDNTLMFAFSLA
jgi:hypothetical protein